MENGTVRHDSSSARINRPRNGRDGTAARAAVAVALAYYAASYAARWAMVLEKGTNTDPCLKDDILCDEPISIASPLTLLAVLFCLLAWYARWEVRRAGGPAISVLAKGAAYAAALPFLAIAPFGLMAGPGWAALLGLPPLMAVAGAHLRMRLFLACMGVLFAWSVVLVAVFLWSLWFAPVAVIPAAATLFLGAAVALRILEHRESRRLAIDGPALPFGPG